jgi:hypothetical protein
VSVGEWGGFWGRYLSVFFAKNLRHKMFPVHELDKSFMSYLTVIEGGWGASILTIILHWPRQVAGATVVG